VKTYKIAKRILKYQEQHGLSYKAMGELLECESSSLHYLLTKSKESLAFQVVDKFEALERKSKVVKVTKDEAWDE